jgi:adenylate cyclase
MGADEGGTLRKLRPIRDELVDPTLTKHHGRLVKTTGDGLLVEFGSVVDALRGTAEVQRKMIKRSRLAAKRQRLVSPMPSDSSRDRRDKRPNQH